ncbi:hypothetical protein llap_9125 [Limosa lapponica baueri]|uniref:Uncharacterized protein n=1 Tax=Limosa lapponica baueri TaxID=1758121 RepID=A0A2I0U3A4_LIMLA|nr:hypothetical protein llap_9125 [Limosa lapponica baueri]
MLGDEKLNVRQQRGLTSQKANCILGCIRRSMASRLREMILPLYSILPHQNSQHSDSRSEWQESASTASAIWGASSQMDIDRFSQAQCFRGNKTNKKKKKKKKKKKIKLKRSLRLTKNKVRHGRGRGKSKTEENHRFCQPTKFASQRTNLRGKSSKEELHFYDKDEG